MSRTTREINRITTTIISMSFRLLFYALVFFLLYEGVTRGYSLGHEIFAPVAVAEAPGRDRELTIGEGETVSEVAGILEKNGMIKNKLIFVIQSIIYDYEVYPGTYVLNTSMTSRDMLKLIDETGIDNEKKSEKNTKAAAEKSDGKQEAAGDNTKTESAGENSDNIGGVSGAQGAGSGENSAADTGAAGANAEGGAGNQSGAGNTGGAQNNTAAAQNNTGAVQSNTGAANEDEAYEPWW